MPSRRFLGRPRHALLAAGAFALCMSAAAAGPWDSTYRPGAAEKLIFRNLVVLDGNGARLDGVDVQVADGRIIDIRKDLPAHEGFAEVVLPGGWLTPGFIDVHTHLGTFPQPYDRTPSAFGDVSELGRPLAADVWVEHGLRSTDAAFSHTLASGVTTVQVLPGSSLVVGGRTVVLKPVAAPTVQAMKFPGAAQGVKLACGSNPAEAGTDRPGFPDSRMGTIAYLREALASARTPAGAARSLADDTFAGILDGSLRVHVHCYRADDIATILDVAAEFGFRIAAVHHATEAYKIRALLRERGVCAAVWPDWWGFKREAEDGIRANPALIDAEGGCVVLHSDIPVVGTLLRLEVAKAIGGGRAIGLEIPPERAVRWITSNAAGVLGLEDRIGRVEKGYNADLVLWTGNPFLVRSRPQLVLVDGVIRVRDGMRPRADFELGRELMEAVP